MFRLVNSLIRRRKLIIIFVISIMSLVTVILVLTPNRYQSTASILPSGEVDKYAELRMIAGFGGSATSDENSSELFPVILQSRLIKDAVLSKSYAFMANNQDTLLPLQEYLGSTNPDILYDLLDAVTTVTTNSKTGVITLSAETIYPLLSQQIVRQYLIELENYNLHKRKTNAGENARYLENQLEIVKTELEAAEDSLESYQSVNRDWITGSDPEILKTVGRLKREITIKSGTYSFLQEQYEAAKLDARKDVPIVQILDNPSLPRLKSGPRRILSIFLSGVAAFFAMIMIIVMHDAIRRRLTEKNAESLLTFRRDVADAFPRSMRTLRFIRKSIEKQTTIIS